MFALPELRYLDVGSNGLASLPPEIDELGKLRVLNASQNKIAFIPVTIKTLAELRAVDLSGNRVTDLSPLCFESSNIKDLRARCNYLTRIPPEISVLKRLEVLDVRYLEKEGVSGSARLFLTPFCCRCNDITDIPESLFTECTQLRILCFRFNKLSYLPQARTAFAVEIIIAHNSIILLHTGYKATHTIGRARRVR